MVDVADSDEELEDGRRLAKLADDDSDSDQEMQEIDDSSDQWCIRKLIKNKQFLKEKKNISAWGLGFSQGLVRVLLGFGLRFNWV